MTLLANYLERTRRPPVGMVSAQQPRQDRKGARAYSCHDQQQQQHYYTIIILPKNPRLLPSLVIFRCVV